MKKLEANPDLIGLSWSERGRNQFYDNKRGYGVGWGGVEDKQLLLKQFS